MGRSPDLAQNPIVKVYCSQMIGRSDWIYVQGKGSNKLEGPRGALRGPMGGTLGGPLGSLGGPKGEPQGVLGGCLGGTWGPWGPLVGPWGALGGPCGALECPYNHHHHRAGDVAGGAIQGRWQGGHPQLQGSHQGSHLKSKDLDELEFFCKIQTLVACLIHQK